MTDAEIDVWQASRLDAAEGMPNPLSIDPQDLDIRVLGEAALATFHLADESGLGRRSVVFRRQGGEWKILHVHASNVRWSSA